jgi:hypothetical protein
VIVAPAHKRKGGNENVDRNGRSCLAVYHIRSSGRRHKRREEIEIDANCSDSRTVAPALEKYAQGPLTKLSKRPGLSPRDRNIVTIAALIARNQAVAMPYYFNVGGQRETFRSGGGCLAGSLPLVLVDS